MARRIVFAQFFHPSTGWNGKDYSGPVKLIEACGSDSIYFLDGRLNRANQIRKAKKICEERGYNGFSICAGGSLLTASEIRPLEVIKELSNV